MKKAFLVLLLCGGLIAVGAPALKFRLEKSRRQHQIGQLWTLIRLYYAPSHGGRYPNDLADLKSLPMYSPFFERAVREIELVAPGIEQGTTPSNTVVLKERTADGGGGFWVH